MKLSLSREDLLAPLQRVIGAVEKRQTMPVLSHVLVSLTDGTLSLTATDLEIELRDSVHGVMGDDSQTTLPARKLLDICKTLPDGAEVALSVSGNKATLKAGRSRFNLSTLAANEFPRTDALQDPVEFSLPQRALRSALQKTAFSMALQDVRYYLNGLLLELSPGNLRAVTTDGHRLSLSEYPVVIDLDSQHQAIVPRKGVQELLRLLADNDADVHVAMTANHVQFTLGDLQYTSKLIDGRFPDYQRVMPADNPHIATIDRETLRQALARVAILANEKYKGVRLQFGKDVLTVQTHNPEQEEAEDEIAIGYGGDPIEIGFNVGYVLDVLQAIDCETVLIKLNDGNSSALVTAADDDDHRYVVMPMRL
ncbi:MAG: DNA polymerase III subunit beta [Pseudomonadota bacterium]